MEPLSEQVRPLGLRNGRSGFGVTTLGFGAAPIANIRGNVSDEEALAAVKDAKDCGCGFFDTAPWYGRGLSERRLGVALSNYERSSYRLQTKVGRFIVAGQPNDRDASGGEINAGSYQGAHGAAFGVVHDYRHDSVLRQHQDSLQRLGVSRIDSLVIHDLDYGHGSAEQIEGYLTELEGGARALADLRTAGTISAFGCGCNNFSQGCDELARRIAAIADLDYFLIAGGHYTLMDQQALDVQFEIMEQNDMSAIIGTPLASGKLTGVPTAYAGNITEAEQATINEIEAVCNRFNVDIKAAALQFPLAHPRVACIIPGGANREQTAENKALVDTKIPGDLWRGGHWTLNKSAALT